MATLLALLTGVLAIVYCDGTTRAFAIGFFVFGASFLALLLLTSSGRLSGDTMGNILSRPAVLLYKQVHGQWSVATHFVSFLEIAHSATAILIGIFGGMVGQFLHRAAQKSRSTPT
jgi:hypothetical protein